MHSMIQPRTVRSYISYISAHKGIDVLILYVVLNVDAFNWFYMILMLYFRIISSTVFVVRASTRCMCVALHTVPSF
jgi:hypothetical protein